MTPREKAVELHKKFKLSAFSVRDNEAKKCALICVSEMDLIYQNLTPKDDPYCFLFEMEFLYEVKLEIEKL